MKNRRTKNIGRRPGGLLAIALAGLLSLSMTASALANFAAAVAAYEQGNYRLAQETFRRLAAAGDERAEFYLQQIHRKLNAEVEDEQEPVDSFASTATETVDSNLDPSDSILNPPDRLDLDPVTPDAATGGGPLADRRWSENAPGGLPAGWEPWTPFDRGAEAAPAEAEPESDVVVPQRQSLWSSLYHLPGDATVVGLQYVAKFLDAETLRRELQSLSSHGDEIALSVLAGFWWLVIIRGLVGIGMGISRFMRVTATKTEGKHYG